ncbi:MAG: DinB family protein [Bacteroidota bacterium]
MCPIATAHSSSRSAPGPLPSPRPPGIGKPKPQQWSFLECLEHLNRYGDFYLPELERVVQAAPSAPAAGMFRSGWLGNYFVQLIAPREGRVTKKMKTPTPMDPSQDEVDEGVLPRFFEQQARYQAVLRAARRVDLTRCKTAISLTPWIKLRLGDTLRFVIFHHLRHQQQLRVGVAQWQQQNVLGKVQ